MFKSAPHSAEFEICRENFTLSIQFTPQGPRFAGASQKGEVEYILMGSGMTIKFVKYDVPCLWVETYDCLGDYRMSEEQWSHAQNLGALLSTVVSLTSFGRINLPAETMTLIVWMVEVELEHLKIFGRY